jgi:hypothetical protein
MSRIDALCTSARKDTPKQDVRTVRFRKHHGLEGDAHAGPGHRQVSRLAAEDIEELRRAALPDIAAGTFDENVVVSGLDDAMRAASLAKTPHAALFRGTSGLCGRTLILNLPGSEKASVEHLQAVLPALGHGLRKLRGDPTPCGQPRRETEADHR